jgi:leucyl aminopeptidase (aminopeptidase T)
MLKKNYDLACDEYSDAVRELLSHSERVSLARHNTQSTSSVCMSAINAASRELVGTVEHAQLQRVADDARKNFDAALEKLYFELSYSKMFRSRVDHAASRRHRASMELSEAELELAKATNSCDDETILELGEAYREAATAYRDAQKKSLHDISSSSL